MRRGRRGAVRRAVASFQRPGWRRWFAVLFTLGLLLAAPALTHAQGAGADSVTLTWTAPGDDSLTGTAAQYDLRMSSSPIDASSWDTATQVSGMPAPLAAGATQQAVVRGLTQGVTYWFAIRTADAAGNWSDLSNVSRWDWVLDAAPPAVPTGLRASRQGGSVQLDWAPDPDPDLLGYTVYRATAAAGPFAPVSGALFSSASWTDAVPSGATSVWYSLTATDATGNESARSAAVEVSLGAGAAFALRPGYPNPSASGVRIPVAFPAGTSTVRIEIVDALGRRVRTLTVGGLTGEAGEARWDGRNDAGRVAPPGMYHAVLLRSSVPLVLIGGRR